MDDLDLLREHLNYDANTGHFTWLKSTGPRSVVGSTAGSVDQNGYVRLQFNGVSYLAHRLAFFYSSGAWPSAQVDHINCDKQDNRLCNLRVVTTQENTHNQRRPQAGNKSGYLGVSWSKERKQWRANIAVNGKQRLIGSFDNPEVAHLAYLQAKRELHPSAPAH